MTPIGPIPLKNPKRQKHTEQERGGQAFWFRLVRASLQQAISIVHAFDREEDKDQPEYHSPNSVLPHH